jgi:hypothetical protein
VPDFTKLFELAGPKAIGLFIACVIIKWANAQGLVSLHEISPNAAAINDVTAILSGTFTVVWFVETIIRWEYESYQRVAAGDKCVNSCRP